MVKLLIRDHSPSKQDIPTTPTSSHACPYDDTLWRRFATRALGDPRLGHAQRAPQLRCRLVRYISTVAIDDVLQQMLQMPAAERAELVERLIDSLDDDAVELSSEELAQLDASLEDADRAVERGELIPANEVLAQLCQIS